MIQILLFFTGTCIGSFLCCLCERLLRQESLFTRSHCDQCGHVLSWKDLFPLMSFLLLRGKCRYCKAPIPKMSFCLESATGIIFVLLYETFGFSLVFMELCILFLLLICVTVCDLKEGIIPFPIVMSILILRIVFILSGHHSLLPYLFDSFFIFFFLLVSAKISESIMKQETLGGGDIKLCGALALFLDLRTGMVALISSCLFGLAISLFTKKRTIPFGPAIAAGFFLWIFLFDKM